MNKLCVFALTVATALSIGNLAFPYADGDIQFWNTDAIEVKVNEKTRVNVEEEFRIGDDLGEFYRFHTDAGINYDAIDWFTVGINYRLVNEDRGGKWREEHRPHINGTFKWDFEGYTVTDRNRLELRIPVREESSFRYRNLATLYLPFQWTDFEVKPYLSDEIFVETNDLEFNENRGSIGINSKVWGPFSADIYYMLNTKKEGDWRNYNVIGLKVKAAL